MDILKTNNQYLQFSLKTTNITTQRQLVGRTDAYTHTLGEMDWQANKETYAQV